MKKDAFAGLLLIIFIIVFIILWSTCSHSLSKELDKIQISADSLINKRVIINKDTLIVIDYSFWESNFTLSNGMKVNEKIIKQNIVK